MAIIPRSPTEKQRTDMRPARSRLERYTEALTYLERGWPVIPVRDKVALKQWRKYQHMLPTDAQLMAWLAEEPCPDIAIVTGAYSGLLVVDVDGADGKASIRGKHIPPTPTARTPSGGRHIFFRHPGGRIRSTTNILRSVDIRADGGYVVAPPAPGREWYEYLSPDDVELADPPDWLLRKLSTAQPKKQPAPGTGGLRRAHTQSFFTSTETDGTRKDVYVLPCPIPEREGTDRQIEAVKTRAVAPEALHSVRGTKLQEWFDRTDVGITIALHMGLPTDGLAEHGRGKGFRCVLHDDKRPSAGLFVHNRSGRVLYHCFHRGGNTYGLPYLAALTARTPDDADRPPSRTEVATWALRLLVETGFVAPARVKACELPDDVTASVQKVYEGFLSLLAVKWLHTPNKATTFSWRFAAGWCGVSKSTVERAMKHLMGEGYIRKVGEYRRTGVFLPGTPEDVANAAERRRPR